MVAGVGIGIRLAITNRQVVDSTIRSIRRKICFAGVDVQNRVQTSALELVLEHLPKRVDEGDEKREAEGVILDEIEPIETGRYVHTNLLPG